MKATLILILIFTLFLSNVFAEHVPHLFVEGHAHSVNSVAFSPDGQTLASGSSDETVRLWDVKTGQHRQTFRGHTREVQSVAFSPDGHLLASGGSDETVRLWDVKTGQHRQTFRGHRHFVLSVAFSPNGQTLASGGVDGTIRLWDVATGSHKVTLGGSINPVSNVAFSPDGRTLAGGSGNIHLWDVATGKHKVTLKGHKHYVARIAFSPDGRLLASGSELFSETGFRPNLHLWDVNTGTHIATLSGHETDILSVAFSPDGKTLASGSVKKQVHPSTFFVEGVDPYPLRLWDVATGTPKKTFALTDDVNSVAFSPDGQTLANAGGTSIYLWDTASDRRKYSIFRHALEDIAFSPDGRTLASGGASVRLWDLVTRHQKRILSGSGQVAFSPDGHILATGNKTGPIHLWNPNTGTLQETFTLPTSAKLVNDIVFSPDGQTLASGGDGITLWNVNTGVQKAWYRSGNEMFESVVFSPDGRTLAVTSRDEIHLWDVNTFRHKYSIDRWESNADSVAASPDVRMIAVGRRKVYVWNTKIGQRQHTSDAWGRHGIVGGPVSPDGRTIVTMRDSKSIDLWDANSGQFKMTFNSPEDFFNDPNITFSPDGRTIASVNGFHTIRLWKLPDVPHVNITPYPVASPAIGEQFTIHLSIIDGKNVGGYQLTVGFDETVLRYVTGTNGDYLPTGSFFVPPVVSESAVTLGATSLTGTRQGDGTLATVTFEVLAVKESVLAVSDAILTDSAGRELPILTNSSRIEPTLSSTSAVVDLTPASVLAPAIGERLAFNIRILEGQNVAGYQIKLQYDKHTLKPVLASAGVYIPGISPTKPFISQEFLTLSAASSTGVGSGDGVLATITFETLATHASTVKVSGYLTTPNGLRLTPTFKDAKVIVALFGDANRDGTVNILDLVLVASSFGQRVPETGNPADVNEDGVVNIVDLVTVAGAIGGGAAAPSLHPQALAGLTAADVQHWLTQAQQMDLSDPLSQRGLRFLAQLLTALIPKETALLVNYPNPFNPETWIPYQLAAPSEVTLTIYAIDGSVVRTLALGHQPVGIYQDKSRAAYWDGRNAVGEPVASGVYFYTLTAGDFTATRKMLIRK